MRLLAVCRRARLKIIQTGTPMATRIPPAMINVAPLPASVVTATPPGEKVAAMAGGGVAVCGDGATAGGRLAGCSDATTAFVGAADTATGGTTLVSGTTLDCGTE
jgi:hypothetical protein